MDVLMLNGVCVNFYINWLLILLEFSDKEDFKFDLMVVVFSDLFILDVEEINMFLVIDV